MNIKFKDYGLRFENSIKRWDEAIPLGNGSIGALVYGNGPLKIAIDRIDLWDNRPIESVCKKDFKYKDYARACKGNKEDWLYKINKYDIRPRSNFPTKLSAGRIILDIGCTSENICSELDIENAITKITCKSINLKSFISAVSQVGIIRIDKECSFKLHVPTYISGNEEDNEMAQDDGTLSTYQPLLNYPSADFKKEDCFTYYIQKSLTDYSYTLMVKQVKSGEFFDLYYTVATTDDNNDVVTYAKELLDNASAKGYDEIFKEHQKWWKKYWAKSKISVCDKEIEKTYYRSWYLFASTSRKGGYPMPLQGVWTADNDMLPPWKGDYHHDTNTQMSYWGYGKANRLDEGRVFADYLWNLRNKFKKFAKHFFQVDGYLLPATSSLNGEFMGGWSQYSLSPLMTVWAAKAFDDYYHYSGDKNFLKNRAFPFLKGVEKGIRGLFVEKDGKYYLPVSTSPEIYEEKQENFRIGVSNFDQSLLLYLYKALIRFCKDLGVDSKEYEEILSKLDWIFVDDEKVIMLSNERRMPFSHRHFSHLMCVYPLNVLKNDSKENEEIIKNSMLEIEQLGTGWWVGFSFPWCATLYASIYNGNAAYEKLRTFNLAFLSQNGFHLNGDYKGYGASQWHYRPFTLEAQFAYCDAVQEMLLQDNKGYIELFPAMPNRWNKAEFKDLRVEKGLLISAKYENGKVTKFSVKSKNDADLKVMLNGELKSFSVNKGNNIII